MEKILKELRNTGDKEKIKKLTNEIFRNCNIYDPTFIECIVEAKSYYEREVLILRKINDKYSKKINNLENENTKLVEENKLFKEIIKKLL